MRDTKTKRCDECRYAFITITDDCVRFDTNFGLSGAEPCLGNPDETIDKVEILLEDCYKVTLIEFRDERTTQDY